MANNKMLYSFVMLLVIEACLYFFGGTSFDQTPIFGFVLNINAVTTTVFYGILITGLAVFAGSQIIPGNFLSISPYAVFAGISILTLTYIANLAHLALFIGGELTAFDPTGTLTKLIYVFIIGPLALLYVMAVFEFSRSNT